MECGGFNYPSARRGHLHRTESLEAAGGGITPSHVISVFSDTFHDSQAVLCLTTLESGGG